MKNIMILGFLIAVEQSDDKPSENVPARKIPTLDGNARALHPGSLPASSRRSASDGERLEDTLWNIFNDDIFN